MAQRVAELPEIRMLSPELPNHPARHREIVGVTFVRPETSLIVYPRLLLPLKLRGAEAITTLLPKRGDRPRVTPGLPNRRCLLAAALIVDSHVPANTASRQRT